MNELINLIIYFIENHITKLEKICTTQIQWAELVVSGMSTFLKVSDWYP